MHNKLDDLLQTSCLETWKTEIKKRVNNNRSVILFGAGATSEFILGTMKKYGFQVTAFCDNNEEKQGMLIDGKIPVLGIKDLKENFHDCYIYITTQLYYVQIRNQLLTEGFSEEQICDFDLVPQFSWEHEYKQYLKKNINRFEDVYSSLSDLTSKEVLYSRLEFLITRKRECSTRIRGTMQYFDLPMISYDKIEHFFDIGTFTGDSILQFLNLFDKSKEVKIYGFEPDRELYDIARKNTKKYADITIYPYGLSDHCGYANFQSSLGRMQTIETALFTKDSENETAPLQLRTLDSMFCNQKYNNAFLKMDIEGAEMGALKGAEHFIISNKPICAICVYHKEDDIVNVWDYLRHLVPEYRFYLRHYSDNQTETVLYAV